MGGLYPESYAEVVREKLGAHHGGEVQIADFGSGSGDWISDMAREFPHAQAIGIDLAPSSPMFETRDLNQEIGGYYGKFDMIQARSITTGVSVIQPHKVGIKLTSCVAQIADYPVFLEKVWHCLKPGGVFMIVDGFTLLYDENFNPSRSTAFSKICSEVASKMQFPNGLGPDFTTQVLSWLCGHPGFKNAQVDNLYIPTGWNGSERYCKEPELAGSIMVENMKKVLSAWRPSLLSAGMSEAKADSWIAEAEKELETPGALKAYTRWIVILHNVHPKGVPTNQDSEWFEFIVFTTQTVVECCKQGSTRALSDGAEYCATAHQLEYSSDTSVTGYNKVMNAPPYHVIAPNSNEDTSLTDGLDRERNQTLLSSLNMDASNLPRIHLQALYSKLHNPSLFRHHLQLRIFARNFL
ncbi:hypothetical protein FRC10_004669 [Ceratobasidium sp. 414]|nr:hypothetical protein FRC10_004669 [Ceratobasidium sp. 414]